MRLSFQEDEKFKSVTIPQFPILESQLTKESTMVELAGTEKTESAMTDILNEGLLEEISASFKTDKLQYKVFNQGHMRSSLEHTHNSPAEVKDAIGRESFITQKEIMDGLIKKKLIRPFLKGGMNAKNNLSSIKEDNEEHKKSSIPIN